MIWHFKEHASCVKCDGSTMNNQSSTQVPFLVIFYLPNHAFELLLLDIFRHVAIYLPRVESHRQSLRHVSLDRLRYLRVEISRTHPEVCLALVLKLRRTMLGELSGRHEGQDNVLRKPLFNEGLNAKRV